MKLFSLDSPFQKYGTLLFDFIALNVFWFFTGIATFGLLLPLANAALFHAMYHAIVEGEGYMSHAYFSVIKKKFFKSIGLTLISIVLYAITIFNIWTVWSGLFDASFLLPVYLMLLFEITITLTFATALLGETDMSIKRLMKYGFLLANKHLLTSILSVVVILGTLYLVYMLNLLPVIFLMAPCYWILTQLIHKRVFTKYYLDKLL